MRSEDKEVRLLILDGLIDVARRELRAKEAEIAGLEARRDALRRADVQD